MASSTDSTAAAASPTEGEEATLGVEEALEMMNVMYAALPTREAALTDNEKEDQQQRDGEQEAEERAEDAEGLEEAAPLPAPPRPSELPSLLDSYMSCFWSSVSRYNDTSPPVCAPFPQ